MPKKKPDDEKLPRGVFERPKGSKIYWIRYRDDRAHDRIEKVGPSLREAVALREAYLTDIRRGDYDARLRTARPRSLADTIAQYLKDALPRSRDGQKLRQFATLWTARLGDYDLDQIEQRHVEAFRSQRLNEGVTPATVNRAVTFLKRVFSVAVSWKWARANPLTSVRKLVENNARVRWLTFDEQARLKEAMPARWWPYVVIALGTGLRLSEQLGLRWADVDFQNGVITIPRSKHGEKRYIPLRDDVAEALRSLPSFGRSPWVTPNRRGTGATTRNWSARDVFADARDAAAVVDFHWHDLRHTFASRLVMAGVPLNTVRELLGHKSITMTLRYAHLAPSHLREAISMFVVEPAEKSVTKPVTATEPDDGNPHE
jgi:integrase